MGRILISRPIFCSIYLKITLLQKYISQWSSAIQKYSIRLWNESYFCKIGFPPTTGIAAMVQSQSGQSTGIFRHNPCTFTGSCACGVLWDISQVRARPVWLVAPFDIITTRKDLHSGRCVGGRDTAVFPTWVLSCCYCIYRHWVLTVVVSLDRSIKLTAPHRWIFIQYSSTEREERNFRGQWPFIFARQYFFAVLHVIMSTQDLSLHDPWMKPMQWDFECGRYTCRNLRDNKNEFFRLIYLGLTRIRYKLEFDGSFFSEFVCWSINHVAQM